MSKIKKYSKKWYEKQNDELVKRIVLARGNCQRCSKTKQQVQLHHHHLITRNNKAYRHKLENLLCLCAGCHMLSPYSAHKDATGFREWLKTTPMWDWYLEHHVVSEEIIANVKVTIYRPIKIKAIPDEEEYENLSKM